MKFKSLFVALLLCFACISAHAATFTVSNLADTNDGTCNADCSLREAITAANAASGADVIIFGNLSGTIQLTSALPNISSNLELRGPSAKKLAVAGQGAAGAYRIFTILNGTTNGSTVTISGLTISNGDVSPASVSGNGGGVFIDYGTLNLTQCIVSGNKAVQGGGLGTLQTSANALLTIVECTFTNNTSSNVGGGVYSGGNATLTNCTISGNSASLYGGGLRNIRDGIMTVRHCTIANNLSNYESLNSNFGSSQGAGLADAGKSVTLSHTLFFNNRYVDSNGVLDSLVEQQASTGFEIVSDHNLSDDDGEGYDGVGYLIGPGDLINTDAILGPLQDNGGPTPTHALPYDSPAVNAGDPNFAAPPDFDQRGTGFPRVIDGRIDIGAFETANPANFQLSINDVSVKENNTATTATTFTVTLSPAASLPVTVNYSTLDGSATAPADYTVANSTITFAAGETTKTIAVFVRGDTLDEVDEQFRVTLNNAVNATLNDQQGLGTIIDDDAAPSVSIDDISAFEGNNGTVNAIFTVDLSARSGQSVTINAIPTNGSAKAPGDYSDGGVRLVFAPGETRKTFSVPVKGDLLNESDEIFYVLLSSPINCSISKGRGIGTIFDDDAKPTISIDDVRIGEGNSGQRVAAFRLVLSAPSGQIVKVNYATSLGSATAGADYAAVPSTQIAFATGSSFVYARVLISGDLLNEPDETFKVNLSNALNATITDTQALGTILNDDSAPSLSIDDVSISEGNTGTTTLTFTVTLSKASGQTVNVNFATADGTAKAGSDYASQSGTLSFAPGSELTRTITIPVTGDVLVEGNETFYVFLSGALNASVGRARGVATITNDEASG